MSSDAFIISLKAKLKTLFSHYANYVQLEEQKKIIQRGYVFSKVDPKADVLIMGINPSQRNDFLGKDLESYDYKDLSNDRYFKKFYNLIGEYDTFQFTYCDLFYQRHTEQKQIDIFLKDTFGKEFLEAQLQLTKEVITFVNPKLILLFNRKAAQFLATDNLGITLKPIPEAKIDELYHIPELDSYMYLSTFIGYRTSKKSMSKVREDIPKLIDFIKFKNEKS